MSTYPGRAKAYADSLAKSKPRSTRIQPSSFTKKTGPPSYAFQDAQTGEKDTHAETESQREEVKKIEDDGKKDEVDKDTFTPATKTNKSVAPKMDTSEAQGQDREFHGVYSKCWTIVDTINMPEYQDDRKSTFIPGGIALFEVLHEMEEILNHNEELNWVSPNYFSLPVRIYYAVIYHVQCLRAKEQSGELRRDEGSWLRAFFRRYKDVSLPIAGPLVPILNNIATYKPDDDQFQIVHPNVIYTEHGTDNIQVNGTVLKIHHPATTRPDGAAVPAYDTMSVDLAHCIIPSVLLLGEIFRAFVDGTLDNKFDEHEQFVPFQTSRGGTFFGFPFAADLDHQEDLFRNVVLNPATMHALPESKIRLSDIRGFWRRSRLAQFPKIRETETYQPSTIGECLRLDQMMDWFEPCVNMATVQTKFFSESANLSNIDTVSGQHTTIVCDLTFANHPAYPTVGNEWYTDYAQGTKALFSSTNADNALVNTWNAAYALTCIELQWTRNGHKIGSVASGMRTGPFFLNGKVNWKNEASKHVMTGIYQMLQTYFYTTRPSSK